MLCALLAVVLHLLVVASIRPRLGFEEGRLIARPLVYSLPPVKAPRASDAPRVPNAAPRQQRAVESSVRSALTRPSAEPQGEPQPPQPEPPAATPTPETSSSPSAPAEQPPIASVPQAPPVHALIPGSLRLKYDILGEARGVTYHADGELLWTHDGRDYEARLEVKAFLLGSRVQTSRGLITPEGLEPLRFADRARRERSVELDHGGGWARFSEGAAAAPLRAGAQDPLSIFIQLASLLASDPDRYRPGSELELQTVGLRDAKLWRFIVEGPQTLNLPIGEVVAQKLTRQVAPGQDELRVEVWFAPYFGWLPARLRLSQPNGDYIDQQWRGTAPP
ncbi:MAG: DUF3108 domain-containing protein [Curvibacter sp.]